MLQVKRPCCCQWIVRFLPSITEKCRAAVQIQSNPSEERLVLIINGDSRVSESSFRKVLEVAASLTELQTRLNKLLERLDKEEDSSIWKTRCESLEISYKEAVTSAKWLRAQNAELEKKVERHEPEMKDALDARDGAFRRLKHARKVIRDLLEERVSERLLALDAKI